MCDNIVPSGSHFLPCVCRALQFTLTDQLGKGQAGVDDNELVGMSVGCRALLSARLPRPCCWLGYGSCISCIAVDAAHVVFDNRANAASATLPAAPTTAVCACCLEADRFAAGCRRPAAGLQEAKRVAFYLYHNLRASRKRKWIQQSGEGSLHALLVLSAPSGLLRPAALLHACPRFLLPLPPSTPPCASTLFAVCVPCACHSSKTIFLCPVALHRPLAPFELP